MAKAQATVTINAPVEKVFSFVNDPNKLMGLWPNVAEVKNVKGLPNGGNSFDFVYKMAGIRVAGTSEDIEVIPNQRVVNETRGGVKSKMIWTLEPTDGRTKLDVDVEYTVPVPVLGKLAEAIIVKMNNRDLRTVFAHLKDVLEE